MGVSRPLISVININQPNTMKTTKRLEITVDDKFHPEKFVGGINLINALLSGDFIQGNGTLKHKASDNEPFKHCCLGVVCEIQGTLKEQPHERYHMDGSDNKGHGSTGTLSRYNPWYSILHASGEIPDFINVDEYVNDVREGKRMSLIGLNDSGWSFSVIAQIISICWDCEVDPTLPYAEREKKVPDYIEEHYHVNPQSTEKPDFMVEDVLLGVKFTARADGSHELTSTKASNESILIKPAAMEFEERAIHAAAVYFNTHNQ